ncbi:MAG TPA: DegV family protein, partial [Rectinemataceae bacterium]|nr:DegV family protein [Rectinemataceae bacterium]
TLINNSSNLDAINVFPIADGDTGTNMAGTVRSMMASLAGRMPSGAGHVLKTAARSALEGARGNSGAILAQFFSCLASEIGSEARINAKKLAAAAVAAAEHTRKALSSPREGTILTVLHEWAAALEERARHSDDILHIFMGALDSAKASLARTRDMLPEMRRAGVVDAGAKGFVHLLEGIADFMTSGRLERRRAVPSPAVDTGVLEDAAASSHAILQAEAIPEGGARFCTEAMLHGFGIDQARIRETLRSMGESIVVAGSDDTAKIHIHTNTPDKVFDYLESQGELSGHKVDDMELQTRLASRGRRRCAIVVDTGCDLPEDFLLDNGIIKVPALITLDGKSRIDGPGLSLAAIHLKMENDPGFSMSTSQPSDAGFARAFSIALSNAEEVLYIGLSSGLSGTFEAASRAARKYEGKIVCVDSKSVTAGSGI